MNQNKRKYLSKNNLNYKRIDLINSIFPNSIFFNSNKRAIATCIFAFKSTSNILLNYKKEDDFIRRYMNYLGHNEFGLNHKSWNKPVKFKELNNINYWLEQWYLFYKNILKNIKIKKIVFL